MSDNFREMDNDGSYKSRRSTTGQNGRSGAGGKAENSGSGGRKPQGQVPRRESGQRNSHSSAVGRYTEGSSSGSSQDVRRTGFQVNISEDDYYDGEEAKREMSAARSASRQTRR